MKLSFLLRLISKDVGQMTRNANLHVVRSVEEMHNLRRTLYKSERSKHIGFVPTMGALHEGHISLVRESMKTCDTTIVSIFVNPTQFSAGEDLDKYPRQEQQDLEMLSQANVDYVFVPSTSELVSQTRLCHVEPSAFSNIFEGIARPEFFRGVATIVTKLFNIIRPDVAYFGQKDISQCILVTQLVKDLNIPTLINICPTVREVNGLAMSSRNAYLKTDEKEKAAVLYKALLSAQHLIEGRLSIDPYVEVSTVLKALIDVLSSEKSVSKIEYVSIASAVDMKELTHISLNEGGIISCAIRLGNVRLIDNVLVGAAAKKIIGSN